MTRDGLPPTGAVAAEARNFELTESQREIIGVVASGVEEVLHAQEPNQEPSRVGTFCRGWNRCRGGEGLYRVLQRSTE